VAYIRDMISQEFYERMEKLVAKDDMNVEKGFKAMQAIFYKVTIYFF
jgi:hypothetical protein